MDEWNWRLNLQRRCHTRRFLVWQVTRNYIYSPAFGYLFKLVCSRCVCAVHWNLHGRQKTVHTVYGSVRRCTHVDARRRMLLYIAVRPRAPMYGDVPQRTSTHNTADAKLYASYRCCQWAQLRCRPSPYGEDGNATQHAAQTSSARLVRHIASVAVRRRSVCERCRRNQRARLQRRRTAPYVVWTGFYVALNVDETRLRCIDHAADVHLHQLARFMVYGITGCVRTYYKILYGNYMQSHQIRSSQKLTDSQLKFVYQTEFT